MAFAEYGDDQPVDVVEQLQEKAAKVAEVAKVRDMVFNENEDKPVKLIFMAVGIGWAIYHFLIKR